MQEIAIYDSKDGTVELSVDFRNDTIWATQSQIEKIFAVDQSGVSRHIRNIFKSGEIDEKSNMQKMHIPNSDKPVAFYSLDVILSVGYRANSGRAIEFRKWANRILKSYIINGYAFNQRFEHLENRVSKTEEKIDFFVKTSLPPIQGIFFDGQIFDAYVFVCDLIKSARETIVLIDNYIDESVLLLLSKRQANVNAQIYTKQITPQLKLDLTKHNSQYDPINIGETSDFHDRFLIIDDTVYHIGASLKDLGKKLFAFSKMESDAFALLEKIKKLQ